MKQASLSAWLKGILAGVGVCCAVIYAAVLPMLGLSIRGVYPEKADCFWPWLVFLWATGVPCFAVLVLGWRISANIGADRSFCEENARLLERISALAAGDTAFFFAGNLVLLLLNKSHPSVMLLSMFVLFAGVSVAVAAAVLSRLVTKAAALQEQSDLTI